MAAFNPAISKAIADNRKYEDNVLHDDQTQHTITNKRMLCLKYIRENIAGKPYEHNYNILRQDHNIFNRGLIYEILTQEVCSFIKKSFEACEADIIYFHCSSTGIESCCIKKSTVFGDNIPEMFSYDICPKSIDYSYDYVEKMNVKDQISDTHKDKRIMVVYVYPHKSIFDKIMEGITINKDNYVGAIFIGDLLSNTCVPNTINLEFAQRHWSHIEFGTCPSTSFNGIYDPFLSVALQVNLELEHYYYKSTQLFYINNNVSYKKKPIHNPEGWKKLQSLLNLNTKNILIILMIEHIYLIKYFGITWDYDMVSIPMLLHTILTKLSEIDFKKVISEYKHYENIDSTQDPNKDTKYNAISFPKESKYYSFVNILNQYLKMINLYKKQIIKILFIKDKKNVQYNDISTNILPFITLKTDVFYRQKLNMILLNLPIYNIEEIKSYYCHVCLKPYKYKCAICNNGSYCSKTCQRWDWTINNHRDSCKIITKLNNNTELNKKLNKMIKTNSGNVEQEIYEELKKMQTSK